jgi:hypothetical protein
MTNDDERAATGWFSPVDALRRVQELGAQLASAARSMSEAAAESQPGTLPMAQWGERAVELSTLWVAPMRAVLEEQQEIIDTISAWAEEQRKLADRFAELANRHREMTADLMGVLTPSLDNLDLLAGRKPAKKPTKQSAERSTKRKTTAKKRA